MALTFRMNICRQEGWQAEAGRPEMCCSRPSGQETNKAAKGSGLGWTGEAEGLG